MFNLKELLIYDPTTGIFNWKVKVGKHNVGDVAGTKQRYVRIRISGKDYMAHRLAWLYAYGCWPVNQIDHINRDKLDNRLCNLRDVPQSINQRNVGLRKDNSSGVRGVSWDSRHSAWRVQILGKFTGHFPTIEDAARAVQSA